MTRQPPHSLNTSTGLQVSARPPRVRYAEPIFVGPHVPGLYGRYGKPLFDRLCAFVLLVLFFPIFLGVTVALWLTLGSPVLIRQPRVGLDGRVFGMYKFRTMHPDRRQTHKLVPPDQERRRTHKSDDDPRHTPLGRVLRRTSVDELPQLLNVLVGHMSLVGPRPELEEVITNIYEPWQLQRHRVKPGMTGLWQVTARAHDSLIHNNAHLDLEYIHRLSLATDLRILLKTPTALGRGS